MTDTKAPIDFTELSGRTILDSRGWPTVEARARLDDGTVLVASCASGASTGDHEAAELRDHGEEFSGRGVRSALSHLNGEIADLLTARSWVSIAELDEALRDLDGTPGYSRLGANAVVTVSMIGARAFAHSAGLDLHEWIALQTDSRQLLPVPHFNVLNGGAHAANALGFQEFMVAPVGAESADEALRVGAEVHHALADLVRHRFCTAGLGDEGGFAPQIEDPRTALDLLVEAISAAGHTPGVDEVAIALDPAANGFRRSDGKYDLNGLTIGRTELVDYYGDLVEAFPIRSLEDGFAEDDPAGWAAMAQATVGLQLVGDDLFVTDPARIRLGAERGWANAALIKPNQIGTVTQTLEAITTARDLGMACMVSHRSGETNDSFIADLAVGAGVGQIKAGAPVRGERLAKYNRLTEIARSHPKLPYGLA